METVITTHNLDIEALKSSRLPMAGGAQPADPAITQFGGTERIFISMCFVLRD